jgi:hypothetical protein
MSIETALARTLLLMRDEVGPEPPEGDLVRALTTTRIALIADDDGLSTHAGQSCCVTAALLMARSGHAVHLLMPDVPMIGAQPPLVPGNLRASLIAAGNDLLPGVTFETGTPEGTVDLAVALCTAPIAVAARHAIRLRADGWRGMVVPAADSAPFGASWWPFGGMAAGALAAGEAFKISMHKLARQFCTPERLHNVFRLTDHSTFELAPEKTPYAHDLGPFDCISGGAITHAALYALARVPGVSGKGRYRTNVWDYAGVNSFSGRSDLEMHPTVKPVALIADAIRDCSNRTGIVLDPFGGSGSTLIAAEKTSRRARLVEIDPLYADTIIKRWQTLTGQSAIDASSGAKFAEAEKVPV